MTCLTPITSGEIATASPVLLTVDQVSHRRGHQQVLDSIQLDVREGEILTLLGPSGCGKSTLLRLIGGLDLPDSGRILMDGVDLSRQPAARRPINTVFQSYALFPHLDVAGNIGFGLRMLGWGKAAIATRVTEMLDLVRLTDIGDRRIADLSGGQQQRVALARAIAPRPRLLLLDEPLSALDSHLRHEMQNELRRIQRALGMTFVLVTHDRDEALSLSDRIAVMEAGRIAQCDRPEAIHAAPTNRFVAGFVGEVNFLPAAVRCVNGDQMRIRSHLGTFDLPHDPCGRRTAGPATLMIRPERVVVGVDEGLRLTARFETSRFLGAAQILTLRLPCGAALTAATPPGPLPAPGDVVSVTLPFRHMRVLEGAP